MMVSTVVIIDRCPSRNARSRTARRKMVLPAPLGADATNHCFEENKVTNYCVDRCLQHPARLMWYSRGRCCRGRGCARRGERRHGTPCGWPDLTWTETFARKFFGTAPINTLQTQKHHNRTNIRPTQTQQGPNVTVRFQASWEIVTYFYSRHLGADR